MRFAPNQDEASVEEIQAFAQGGFHAYFTSPPFLEYMKLELESPLVVNAQVLLSKQHTRPAFALDVWPHCELLPFQSIKEASHLLKSRGHLWFYYGDKAYRRGALVGAHLRLLKTKPLQFGLLPPDSDFGIYTLLNEQLLLCCAQTEQVYPLGEFHFIENKEIPPNRAYLKLWEAFTLLRRFPKPGEKCLDLGASPGGWSWVLAECGAEVLAVDKAALVPHIAKHPKIQFQLGSAFALNPEDFTAIDWLCCDIICYPSRLVPLLEKWIRSGRVKHIVASIKLQGDPDWASIQYLQGIENARVFHLFQNKHELCFVWSLEPL